MRYRAPVDERSRAAAALRDKYLEIQALRLEADQAGAADPRSRMRKLASRFPGALRELDRLSLGEIASRLTRLAALADAVTPELPAWVRAQTAYHGWMRLALAVKRQPTEASAQQVHARLKARHRPGPLQPEATALTTEALAKLREPGVSRLNSWVFVQVGRTLELSADEAEQLVFEAC